MIGSRDFFLVAASRSTIFNPAPSVTNRSAMPDAKIASVSGSRTENFKDELPQLMTRMRQGAGTLEQWPNLMP